MLATEEASRLHQQRRRRAAELHTVITAATAELLSIVAEVDASESFFEDGNGGLTDWLAGTLRLSPRTARSWIRLARKLRDYPEVEAALSAGVLTVDQVAALVRYVSPDEADAEFVAAMRNVPAGELEDVARSRRRISVADAREERALRTFHSWFSDDERTYFYRGRLPAEEGVIVEAAVDLLATQAPLHEDCGLFRPFAERGADAIVQMASEALAGGGNPDRATVVVHVDAAVVAGNADGLGHIEFGPAIPAAAASRMACDGRIQLVAHSSDGSPIGVGRTSRSIPYWLERLVRRRDGGCRFPACERTRWTNVHHIAFWTRDDGPTDYDNLVTLCGYHHRLIHDGGWTVHGDPADHLTWRRHTGAVYRPPDDQFETSFNWQEYCVESLPTVEERLARLRANSPP